MKNKKGFTLIELLIVVAILGIVGTVVFSAIKTPAALAEMTRGDESRVRNTLSSMGFKDASLRPASWTVCGKDDSLFSSNDFTATNPLGTQVSGTVCCGFMKGCTVRF